MSKKIRNTVLMAGLCAMLTGCTAHRPAALPEYEGEPASERPATTVLAPTAVARLTLVDGSTVEGDVLRVTPDAVVFGKVGNYGMEEIVIPAEDIVAIEIREPTCLSNTVILVGTTAVVTFMAVVALFAIAMRDVNLS